MYRTLRALRDRFADWRARRAAIDELRRYDDARLADLGITREEIPDYVRGRPVRAGPGPRPAHGAEVIALFPAGSGSMDSRARAG